MAKPSVPLLFSFNLAVVGEIVAMVTDASLLVQLALAWSACVCADLLRDADRLKRG
jgi:hypothetical protein